MSIKRRKRIRWRKFTFPEIDIDEDSDISEFYEKGGAPQMAFDPDTLRIYELHANFYIDEEMAHAIANTEGVESFRVTTPYRAIVGFGRLFSIKSTKKRILRKINHVLFPKE